MRARADRRAHARGFSSRTHDEGDEHEVHDHDARMQREIGTGASRVWKRRASAGERAGRSAAIMNRLCAAVRRTFASPSAKKMAVKVTAKRSKSANIGPIGVGIVVCPIMKRRMCTAPINMTGIRRKAPRATRRCYRTNPFDIRKACPASRTNRRVAVIPQTLWIISRRASGRKKSLEAFHDDAERHLKVSRRLAVR